MNNDKIKNEFKRTITDFIESEMKSVISREYDIPLDTGKIIALTGIRRCGKTSLMFQLIQKLRKEHDDSQIVYINFEDDRLYPLDLEGLGLLIDAYYELFPDNRDRKLYLFLDEVHVVDRWELFVRRIYDSLNISIFITGSSSKLLSSEIATSLRGRALNYEIFPLSFSEYLNFQNIDINIHSSRRQSYIINALNTYLAYGGFPEAVAFDDDLKRRILIDYLDLIIYKDISERFSVQNTALLKLLIKHCYKNCATHVSLNKLFNDFKSQGLKLGKDTLFDYFSYLEEAYSVFITPIFRNSLREQNRNPKKVYAADNGFKSLFDLTPQTDTGHRMKNAVYLHLRRKTKDIYYVKEKQEVDFYTVINSERLLINVCQSIADADTGKREVTGLVEAMKSIGLNQSYLITEGQEELIEVETKKIYALPLWKWLLEL